MEMKIIVFHLGYLFTEIPFDNVVYEFHDYIPWQYVSQDSNSTYVLKYPQDNVVIIPSNAQLSYVDGLWLWGEGEYNNSSPNTWQVLKNNTPEAVPTTGNINNGYVQIYLENLASNTTVTIDEIKVSEYDKSNNFIRDVYLDDFSNDYTYHFFDNEVSSDTRVQNSTNAGYSGNDAKIIQGPTGSSAAMFCSDYLMFFNVNPNNKYQVSVRVKVQNPGPSTVVVPAIVYSYCEGQVYYNNKSYIQEQLQPYIDYSNQKNVPVFLGEYGISNWCFEKLKKISDGTYLNEENLGGEQWIDDMLSVISDNKLSSSYWVYDDPRTDSWGLYAYVDPYSTYVKTYVNEYLENAFRNYFSQF